jgi:hypothetical protein
MAYDANRELVLEHLDALLRGDMTALTSGVADDFVQEWPQSGERVRGKEACTNVYRNYPGGPPTGKLRRLRGAGDLWVAEIAMDYSSKPVHSVAIIELNNGKLIRETDYFGDPFPAPDWRQQWVERVAPGDG